MFTPIAPSTRKYTRETFLNQKLLFITMCLQYGNDTPIMCLFVRIYVCVSVPLRRYPVISCEVGVSHRVSPPVFS